jgi:hypothetical protein
MMTVAELIEQLKDMNQNAEVHFAHGSGDYWRTVVAPKVDMVSEGYVKYSEYHRMDKIDDGDEIDESAREVVILE